MTKSTEIKDISNWRSLKGLVGEYLMLDHIRKNPTATVFLQEAFNLADATCKLKINESKRFEKGIEKDIKKLVEPLDEIDKRISGKERNEKEDAELARGLYDIVSDLATSHKMADEAYHPETDKVDNETRSWIWTIVSLFLMVGVSIFTGWLTKMGLFQKFANQNWVGNADTLYFFIQTAVQMGSLIVTMIICFAINRHRAKKNPNTAEALKIKYGSGKAAPSFLPWDIDPGSNTVFLKSGDVHINKFWGKANVSTSISLVTCPKCGNGINVCLKKK